MPEKCVIIPAAGLSSRHPPNKLLLKLEGRTVIERTVSIFIDFPLNIVVVTGYQREKTAFLLRKNFGTRITVIDNPDYSLGMSSSIKAAVRALKQEYGYIGICPADKPFIRKTTIADLLDTLDKELPLIAAPFYNGQMGHPCFFSGKLKKELLTITGDMGGREIVTNYRERLLEIQVNDEGITLDMDRYLDGSHVR